VVEVEHTITESPSSDRALEATPRPQLFVQLGPDLARCAPSRHQLEGVDEVRLGRGRGRSATRSREAGRVVLTLELEDGLASSRHAVLRREGRAWQISDLASKNGTVVDGVSVTQTGLADEALIELGQTVLLFRDRVPVGFRTAADLYDAETDAPLPTLATFHDPLREIFHRIVRLAQVSVPVLLQGETGTGKEVVAQAVHRLSQRPGTIVAVNCAAIPTSLVEAELFGHKRGAFTGSSNERVGWIRSAERGTLFLDEIGELPLALQAAFLRALETGEVVPVGADRPISVDFRLVSATNRDLSIEVDAGRFRADLLARLGAMAVTLPPLRARREDLGGLVRAVLRRLVPLPQALPGLRRDAARALLAFDWPGNVRQLVQVLSQALALREGDAPIGLEHLPALLGVHKAPTRRPHPHPHARPRPRRSRCPTRSSARAMSVCSRPRKAMWPRSLARRASIESWSIEPCAVSASSRAAFADPGARSATEAERAVRDRGVVVVVGLVPPGVELDVGLRGHGVQAARRVQPAGDADREGHGRRSPRRHEPGDRRRG
jgi:transcriptional regulator with AAA-type ATPase domain